MKSSLIIENIECYSFHGCLPQELKIGGRFSVDVKIEMDLSEAVATDDLTKTADYVQIHQLVHKEMDIPSRLIEHVAGRILSRLSEAYPYNDNITVRISKYNPPVNGSIGIATVELALH